MLRSDFVTHVAPPAPHRCERLVGLQTEQSGEQPDRLLLNVARERLKCRRRGGRMKQRRLRESHVGGQTVASAPPAALKDRCDACNTSAWAVAVAAATPSIPQGIDGHDRRARQVQVLAAAGSNIQSGTSSDRMHFARSSRPHRHTDRPYSGEHLVHDDRAPKPRVPRIDDFASLSIMGVALSSIDRGRPHSRPGPGIPDPTSIIRGAVVRSPVPQRASDYRETDLEMSPPQVRAQHGCGVTLCGAQVIDKVALRASCGASETTSG